MSDHTMNCQLLMTGNELMTGVTVDTNSTYIAEQLTGLGIHIGKKITVGDQLKQLESEINAAAATAQLLIINGGLGPTTDDLTAQALANVLGVLLENRAEAEQHIRDWCAKRGLVPNDANLKQALLPQNSRIIPNPVGSAVGIAADLERNGNRCLVLCTPGVPSEMRKMIGEQVLPLIKQHFPDCEQQFIKRLQIFGMGESSIQQQVHNHLTDWPEQIELGFRAGAPSLEVKLTARSEADLPLRDEWESKLREVLGHHIFGENDDTLPGVVVDLLRQRGQQITFAESCTGGLIASMLTGIAGSSNVFCAGFVTYSNDIKQSIVNVSADTLATHGAVSEACVREMHAGALEKSGADVAIAVSGIAGPGGGSEEKPVGTVWIAWGSRENPKTHCLCYPVERKFFQTMVAAYSLDLIRRELLGIDEPARYMKKR